MNVYSDGPLLHRFIQQLDVVSHHRIEQLMSLLQEMVMNMKATHNIMKAHKCWCLGRGIKILTGFYEHLTM